MVAIILAGGDGGGGDLPRSARLIFFFFILATTLAVKKAQQIGGDIHEALGASVSEYGKNHLRRGSIRPLLIHGAYVGRDTSALRPHSSAEAKFGTRHQLPTAAASDVEPSGHRQPVALPQHLPTSAADAAALNPALAAVLRRRGGSREAVAPPTAIAPPVLSASEEQAESAAAEALSSLTRSAAAAQPVHVSTESKQPPSVVLPHYHPTLSTEVSRASLSAAPRTLSISASSSAEATQPLAKWRKIGPLIDRRGGSSTFQRMRLVKQQFLPDGVRASAESTRESADTTAMPPETTTTHAPPHFTVASSPLSSAPPPFSSTPKIVAPAQHVPTQDDASSFRATTRAAVMAATAAAAENDNNAAQRRYRQQKPRINGPLLAPAEDFGGGIVHSSYSGGEPLESAAPRIYENPASSAEYGHEASDDYHHRRSVQVDRRFKLSSPSGGKVGYRPRLRIRRPDEQPQQAAGATIFEPPSENSVRAGAGAPIRLPQLTPFQAEAPSSAPSTLRQVANAPAPPTRQFQRQFIIEEPTPPAGSSSSRGYRNSRNRGSGAEERPPPPNQVALPTYGNGGGGGGGRFVVQPVQRFVNSANGYVVSTTFATSAAPEPTTTPRVPSDGENYGSVGEQPPQPSPQRAVSAAAPDSDSTDSGLAFANIGPLPPGISAEAFGLSGTDAVKYGIQSTDLTDRNELHATTTQPAQPPVTRRPPPLAPKPAPAPPVVAAADATFVIPENSGLRPVKPPSELQGGFGSSGRNGPFGGGFGGGGGAIESFGGGGGGRGGGLPTNHVQVEPPTRPAGGGGAAVEGQPKEEDFFTGESALSPNRRGPTGDGYGPPVLEGAAVPPLAPPGPVNYGGAAAGIRQPPPPRQEPSPSTDDAEPPMSTHTHQQHQQPFLMETAENQPTTVKPSALLSILNRADEGFNQVISHFEAGTPIEAAAIDVLEVALGSQKLDSQAKLLSHVDRTVGLDNLQRLQRWANTGGALDMLKEQFAKMAKNYKPPPETKAFTIPPQLEYLFQSGGSGGGGKR